MYINFKCVFLSVKMVAVVTCSIAICHYLGNLKIVKYHYREKDFRYKIYILKKGVGGIIFVYSSRQNVSSFYSTR